MPFDRLDHACRQAFAMSTREKFAQTEEGPKKSIARKHLRNADIAERVGSETAWVLAITYAARVLCDDDLKFKRTAEESDFLINRKEMHRMKYNVFKV